MEDAIADLNGFCVEPQPEYMGIYLHMYKLQEFQALQHHPNLIAVMKSILGEPVMPHARIIGRTIFPQREVFTTPPHQDFIPIQGTADTYTAWIPLTDIPAGVRRTPDCLRLAIGKAFTTLNLRWVQVVLQSPTHLTELG